MSRRALAPRVLDVMDDEADTPKLLASRGYHDPVATPHVFAREEPTQDGLAQIYRCVITGAERRYGLHAYAGHYADA